MSRDTFHGVVQGKTIVLDDAGGLIDGTQVIVIPLETPRGSSAAVLAAMAAQPRVSAEDVAEMNLKIAQGRRPLSRIDPFNGNPASSGSD